ncbi:MAG TPA: GNAT family N-acetyltransferase [Alphaproteobacteria bacterium]|nr:GNAT family N-acetyltransferase [Alphaproteobacteria bacterium]
MSQILIRRAKQEDAGTLMRLILELAEFEKLAHEVRASAADLVREGFGARPHYEAVLAEEDGRALGFALFFFSFSTFEGRPGLHLEDIFVIEEARGRGVGRKLMASLAKIAVESNCARLDLSVLHWNPARRFYDRLGMEQMVNWVPYRLSGPNLAQLAAEADER